MEESLASTGPPAYTPGMKSRRTRWIPLGLALASLVLLAAGTMEPIRIELCPSPELRPFVGGSLDCAAELLPKLKTQTGNLVFSPYSLASVLAVAQTGARGKTAEQITHSCHFSTNQAEHLAALARVRKELAAHGKRGSIQLNSATGLWAQKDYDFEKDFVNLVRREHGAEVEFVDYVNSAGAVADQINSWIKKNTKGKITGGISRRSVTSGTRMIVANAIYFKGDWASRFERNVTHQRPFHLAADSSVDVPTMAQENNFYYGEADDVQMLVLPYVGHGLHMLVLLPKQGELGRLGERLGAGYLESWANKLHLCKVEVRLPRFNITSTHSLKEPLQALGLQDAFDPALADFTRMSARRPLFIQTAEQTTLVEVNEEGTVAAAATQVSVGCSAPAPLPQQKFHADRPFLFLIRESNTGMILFLGRVVNPLSTQ